MGTFINCIRCFLLSQPTQSDSNLIDNGILLPKLFWPNVRHNCSSDQEKLLKFETEDREFANILRSLEQFIQTVKGLNNFWVTECFFFFNFFQKTNENKLTYKVWETSRNKLEKHSVTKNCSDLSLFE